MSFHFGLWLKEIQSVEIIVKLSGKYLWQKIILLFAL